MGEISVKGSKCLIKAELSTLIHTLKYDDVLTEEEINKCVMDGFMSEEDIDNKIDSSGEALLNTLKDLLEILHSEE